MQRKVLLSLQLRRQRHPPLKNQNKCLNSGSGILILCLWSKRRKSSLTICLTVLSISAALGATAETLWGQSILTISDSFEQCSMPKTKSLMFVLVGPKMRPHLTRLKWSLKAKTLSCSKHSSRFLLQTKQSKVSTKELPISFSCKIESKLESHCWLESTLARLATKLMEQMLDLFRWHVATDKATKHS